MESKNNERCVPKKEGIVYAKIGPGSFGTYFFMAGTDIESIEKYVKSSDYICNNKIVQLDRSAIPQDYLWSVRLLEEFDIPGRDLDLHTFHLQYKFENGPGFGLYASKTILHTPEALRELKRNSSYEFNYFINMPQTLSSLLKWYIRKRGLEKLSLDEIENELGDELCQSLINVFRKRIKQTRRDFRKK